MFSITNQKVAGFAPLWKRFRGFSILFDSPGHCLRSAGEHSDLACDVDGDPELGFYRSLRDSLDRLKPHLLTTTYLFCPLPPPSYHATVWDGANDGNAPNVRLDRRTTLEEFLAGLPGSIAPSHPITDLAIASPLVQRRNWNIEFEFDQLAMYGALVAHLSPTKASQDTFREFVRERQRLNTAFFDAFDIRASDNYNPHVSLGYFANHEGMQMARPMLPEWNQLFSSQMQGRTITFRHASVYGFTDMATFFKTNP